MGGSDTFFSSGTFYLIIWIICGISYFVFRKKHKAEDDEYRKKAAEVNRDSIEKIKGLKERLGLSKKDPD